MPPRSAVRHQSTIALHLAQGEHAHPQVLRSFPGGHEAYPIPCHFHTSFPCLPKSYPKADKMAVNYLNCLHYSKFRPGLG